MSTILTPRDQEMACYIWQSMKETPEIDLEKLASLSGHKSKTSANSAYHRVKSKLSTYGGNNDEESEDAEVDVDALADTEETPAAPVSKKARGKKPAAGQTDEPVTDEDDEPEAVPVKPKAKGKARASRASTSKAATPKAAPKPRVTRTSIRARKPLPTGVTSDDEDEVKKPEATVRTGRRKYPQIEDVSMDPTAAGANDESAAGAEEPTADTNTLKRAATEPASDIDELAEPDRVKRAKHDADVEATVDSAVDAVVDTPAETTTAVTVVSTDPMIESFVVVTNPDAVDLAEDITWRAAIDSEAEDGFDIRSDVASAADSGERDI